MSSSTYTSHYSVLYSECYEYFQERSNSKEKVFFADMTFGGGGHTLGFAESFKNAIFYSVDQDPEAFENGTKLIKERKLENRVNLIRTNYENFPIWVEENLEGVHFDGILMDLGVSSHHFDKFERGFSFREDAPLDMRMDFENDEVYTASEVLNNFNETEIADIIYKYGEEHYSRRIAKNIIEKRNDKPIETTKELEDIVFHSYPKHLRHKKIHPATKTFQALRIFVNRELEVLENTIEKLYDILAPGGLLAIISFHSLEDRIVKHTYKEISQKHKNIAKILTKKPIYPSEKEISENSRSRSAKLRVLLKSS